MIGIQSNPLKRAGLPLPGGCEVARMIDGVREVCVYWINTDGFMARWDLIFHDTQFHARDEYFGDDCSHEAIVRWLDERRPVMIKAILDYAENYESKHRYQGAK